MSLTYPFILLDKKKCLENIQRMVLKAKKEQPKVKASLQNPSKH